MAAEKIVDIDEELESLEGGGEITYFGTDFDVKGLVTRMQSGDVVIPRFDPESITDLAVRGFQREFVWKKVQSDRFIESLLLGYPVPGIFLVQNPDKRMLVLDGQQRLTTLRKFYEGRIDEETVFRLEYVKTDFRELSYDRLSPELRRTLDNTFIHATVVKSAGPQADTAIYQIFERLNTGGTNLGAHEIRVALYNGEFVRFIRDLNHNEAWRALFGKRSQKLKDQELILRFFAFLMERDAYKKPLKGFLNTFLAAHKNMEGLQRDALKRSFEGTCSVILDEIGKDAFRVKRQLNAAHVDALLIAVATRLAKKTSRPDGLEQSYRKLLADDRYQHAIARATADEESVKARFERAIALLAA